MCPLSLSALTYTKADSLKVVQLLDAGKKQTRGTHLFLFAGIWKKYVTAEDS